MTYSSTDSSLQIIVNVLDSVPRSQTFRAYEHWQGFTGSESEAAWANRKYHGHRTLPPEVRKGAGNGVWECK